MQKLTGLLYLVGQSVILYQQCVVCKRSLAGLREQTCSVCSNCLAESGAQLGVMLVVHPPSTASRWN